MRSTRHSLTAAVSAAVLAGPVAALADTARTTADLSLRTGPSTSYERVAVIPEGASVDMSRCTPDYGWCQVAWGGYSGWSSANYLVKAESGQPTLPPAPYDPYRDQSQGQASQADQQRERIAEIGERLAIPVLDFFGQIAAGEEEPRLRIGFGDGPADQRQIGANEVCFYEHYDFRGESLCTRDMAAEDGLRDDWNDRISSVRLGSDARIEVCEHYDYGGNCRVIASDNESLSGGWNDVISSYRGVGAGRDDDYAGARPGQVCFYEHVDYGGSRHCVSAASGTANLQGDWNDTVSSIRVGAHARIRVCEHYDAGGRCQVIDGDVASLGGVWNDTISSYGGPAWTPPSGGERVGRNEVCFYEHNDFDGSRYCVDGDSRNAGLGAPWNDAISSIRVGANAAVEVCEHYDFAGTCTTVSGDVAALRDGWNDAISSYRVQ